MFNSSYTGGYVGRGYSVCKDVPVERRNIVPEKGGIYLMEVLDGEMKKCKPVIVVSDSNYNKGPFCFICPLTVEEKDPSPTIFKTWATGQASNAILDNLRSINKERLVEYVGQLSNVELQSCADSVCNLFGINTLALPEAPKPAETVPDTALLQRIAELEKEVEFHKQQYNVLLDKLIAKA
jgi:mRNA-degrading endonuclease toxin of MazEF toxin-antitoxin module